MATNNSNSTTRPASDGPPAVPDGWTRCQCYVTKKHRFCRQQRSRGNYCGFHFSTLETASNSSSTTTAKRVPCPIDPSHTVLEDQIERHLKKCPKVRHQRELEKLPYFQRDFNSGGCGSMGFVDDITTNGQHHQEGLEWAKQIATKVLEVHEKLFTSSNGDNNIGRPVASLTQQDIHDSLKMRDYSDKELKAGLPESIELHHMKSGGIKHMQQQASLMGHLRALKVLPAESPKIDGRSSNALLEKIHFLEMGAGRGMLGLVAAGVASACHTPHVDLTLVERSGSRSKADTVLRKARPVQDGSYMQLDKVQWKRISCDLAHVNLPVAIDDKSPSVHAVGQKRKPELKSKTVVIAKHLCGAGTDLALKSLRDIHVDVCLFATCCHGVCSWKDYVGRDFLIQHFGSKFGALEFELLRKWSSGTVANMNGAEHQTFVHDGKDPTGVATVARALGLTSGMQGLGRACQRVLDAGRRDYLKETLSFRNVDMCHYVSEDVSPQNAVLIATMD